MIDKIGKDGIGEKGAKPKFQDWLGKENQKVVEDEVDR